MEIVQQGNTDLASQIAGDIGGGGFLPNLKIIHGTTPEFMDDDKRSTHNLSLGDLFWGDKKNYGPDKLIIQVGPYRAHALWWDGETKAQSFQYNDDDWKTVVKAKATRKEGQFSIGADYLLWNYDLQEFCLYFLKGSGYKTSVASFNQRTGQVAELYTHKIETKRFSWWIPKLRGYEGLAPGEQPTKEELAKVIDTLGNVPTKVKEGEEQTRTR